MQIKFNLAGSQYVELDKPEPEFIGQAIHLVHDTSISDIDPKALSVRTDEGDAHIGYIPRPSYKFKGQQALFDALKFDIPISGVVTEALYKDSAGRFNHLDASKYEAGKKGRGEFVDFEVQLTMMAGDDSSSYFDDEGVEYLRLTKMLEYADWNPEDTGLHEWSVNRFKTYADYEHYLQACAFEGQLIHHKAQLALYKQDLPEDVDPLPPNVVKMIKKVRKVISTEERVFDTEIGVAGTLDADVELGSQRTGAILDWKRSKQVQEKYLRQISFYAHAKNREKAIIVLAGADPKDAFITLQKSDIEKYYDQVYRLAEFVKSVKGVK